MQLFVESWKQILHHSNGMLSLGVEAMTTNGQSEPYGKKRPLYIHLLDVEAVHELQPRKDHRGKCSPPGVDDWWLSSQPKAYLDLGLSKLCRARSTQLKDEYREAQLGELHRKADE